MGGEVGGKEEISNIHMQPSYEVEVVREVEVAYPHLTTHEERLLLANILHTPAHFYFDLSQWSEDGGSLAPYFTSHTSLVRAPPLPPLPPLSPVATAGCERTS